MQPKAILNFPEPQLLVNASRHLVSVRFNTRATHILDFIQVPGFPSAIRVFALTYSRRIVVQR